MLNSERKVDDKKFKVIKIEGKIVINIILGNKVGPRTVSKVKFKTKHFFNELCLDPVWPWSLVQPTRAFIFLFSYLCFKCCLLDGGESLWRTVGPTIYKQNEALTCIQFVILVNRFISWVDESYYFPISSCVTYFLLFLQCISK